MTLSKSEKEELLRLVRETIQQYLISKKSPKFNPSSPNLSKNGGVFVSLHTGNSHQLRGCIGLIESRQPLWQTVQRMAVAAAVQDPRFKPVSPAELPNLTIEISIISPLAKMKNSAQIEVGRHGLVVKQGPFSGLLLPQVATEYGWSKEEFLSQTCLKAGLPKDAWQKNAEVYLFSAEVFNTSPIGADIFTDKHR